MRLSIESSERPGPDADPRIHVARTLSFLNLIDLAGSESAKVPFLISLLQLSRFCLVIAHPWLCHNTCLGWEEECVILSRGAKSAALNHCTV